MAYLKHESIIRPARDLKWRHFLTYGHSWHEYSVEMTSIGDVRMFKQAVDWNIVSFVSLTLIAEYLHQPPKVRLPRIYYWSSSRTK
jgi:hypothetical protein